MDLTIFALLAQDGITNGAIYALLALALVLVFAVTRVIWVPSGEFVAYGTLTLAGLQLGKPPGTIGLLVGHGRRRRRDGGVALRRGAANARRVPRQLAALDRRSGCASPRSRGGSRRPSLPFWAQVLVTLALVTALGPLLYRIAYQPLAEASVLVLLIVSVAVHFALTGLGLWFFGAEGSRTPAFSSASFDARRRHVSVQSLLVVVDERRADRGARTLLRPHAVRQGAARDRVQSRRRATVRHRRRTSPAR